MLFSPASIGGAVVNDLRALLARLEAPAPSPAGGTAAAFSAAAAASLVIMVARGSPSWPEGPHTAAAAEQLRERLLTLGEDDAAAITAMLAVLRAPPGEPNRHEALLQAARVPCEIAQHAADVAKLARSAADNGKRVMAADASIALILAEAATRAAALIVTTNITHFRNDIDAADARALYEAATRAERAAGAA
jgi:formiminotetrahydrofolate cyclodeaminase